MHALVYDINMAGKKSSRVTMRDVAEASGHSLSTVDRVLNARAPVRTDTARRIHEVAEDLGFHASAVIRERVKGHAPVRRLGFLLEKPDCSFYPFYRELGEALAAACSAEAVACRPVVEYLDNLSPEGVCASLRDLGNRVDAIAVVAADHPLVGAEVDALRIKGVPVFSLIADLSTPARAGYAGLDNRRVGRTAAWYITQLARAPGKIGIFVGSHRYHCQELAEFSFRSYVRENAPGFEVLESVFTLESDRMAEEGARALFHRHPDIVGIFVTAAGTDGVLNVLREQQAESESTPPITVVRELTANSRQALLLGYVHAVLSVPLKVLAQRLVNGMLLSLDGPVTGMQQLIVPIDTQTRETV